MFLDARQAFSMLDLSGITFRSKLCRGVYKIPSYPLRRNKSQLHLKNRIVVTSKSL